jgi:hypothetical protein
MGFNPDSAITRGLKKSSTFWFTLYASVAAFCLYTCVYAFRKTYTAATFEGLSYLGVSYKVWLITFQVVGYGLAKFAGIKIIAELRANARARGILLMVGIAGLSWLFFALVPLESHFSFHERISPWNGVGNGIRLYGRKTHDRGTGRSIGRQLYLFRRIVSFGWRFPYPRLGNFGTLDASHRECNLSSSSSSVFVAD